jgi:hypothetical protein
MDATTTTPPVIGPDRSEVGGARLFASDVQLVLLATGEVRSRVLTGVFGIPRNQQSALVSVIAIGALATGARALVRLPRLGLRPSLPDLGIGACLLNVAIRGIAGARSAEIPAAGALIAGAVLAHSLRPALRPLLRESVHDVEVLAHTAEHRYGHASTV